MPEHTLSVTLTAPTSDSLDALVTAVDVALIAAGWAVGGSAVKVACECTWPRDNNLAEPGRLGLFGTVVYVVAALIVALGILRGSGVL
ncbi:hypothetical protein FRAHR75_30013 [Frankia sp. Hr75.2]|nr:hypothetical protein FRAHR75_30013 [Frankia sp. Hr75.2]